MRVTKGGTPIATADGEDREFGNYNGSANCRCNFLRSLDSEADMPFTISDDDDSLEASSLASTSLFLDRFNLKAAGRHSISHSSILDTRIHWGEPS